MNGFEGLAVFAGALYLVSTLISLYVAYWVIRLAVRHGMLDAQQKSEEQKSRMFSGYGGYRPDDQ